MQALLDHDHNSASEEKSDTNVASTFKAITSTNQCLSHLRRAPPIDIRDSLLEWKLPASSELLETTERTIQQKRERDPSPLDQTVTANADVVSRQGGSTVAEPLLERQYSNKRAKQRVDVPESTDGTIRPKNT